MRAVVVLFFCIAGCQAAPSTAEPPDECAYIQALTGGDPAALAEAEFRKTRTPRFMGFFRQSSNGTTVEFPGVNGKQPDIEGSIVVAFPDYPCGTQGSSDLRNEFTAFATNYNIRILALSN